MCGHGVKFSLVLKQACMSVARGTCTLLWWCCARAVGGCFWPISPTGIHCQPSHAWCKCTVLQHGDALFCVGFMGVCAPPPKTLFYLEHKVNGFIELRCAKRLGPFRAQGLPTCLFGLHCQAVGGPVGVCHAGRLGLSRWVFAIWPNHTSRHVLVDVTVVLPQQPCEIGSPAPSSKGGPWAHGSWGPSSAKR